MSDLAGLTTAVLVVAAGLLGVAALLLTARMTLGPTMLDRAVSFDVVVAITIGAIAIDAALRRTGENLSLLLVAAMLGFVGSVSVARFVPGNDDVEAEQAQSAADDVSDDGSLR